MELGRRELLKASAAIAAAMGLESTGLLRLQEALGLDVAKGGVPVVWLQGQNCTGCSVSFLNSAYYTTVEDLLLNTLDVKYHPNIMAAAGSTAKGAAMAAYNAGGYVLVVEGAIPTKDNGAACTIWPGMTALAGVKMFAGKAKVVLAVGACACYGGLASGAPNPTGAQGLDATITSTPIVKIPGCPVHPDWLVGTVAYLLANGKAPAMDANGRPTDFFGGIIHDGCPFRPVFPTPDQALAQGGCQFALGCKGPRSHCDSQIRKWNTTDKGQPGVNWCMHSGAPCIGCTEPGYPDAMAPFYNIPTTGGSSTGATGGRNGGRRRNGGRNDNGRSGSSDRSSSSSSGSASQNTQPAPVTGAQEGD